jgi:hypothetical protein
MGRASLSDARPMGRNCQSGPVWNVEEHEREKILSGMMEVQRASLRRRGKVFKGYFTDCKVGEEVWGSFLGCWPDFSGLNIFNAL